MTLKDIVLTKISSEKLKLFADLANCFKLLTISQRTNCLSDNLEVTTIYDNVKNCSYLDNVNRLTDMLNGTEVCIYGCIEDMRDGSLKMIIGSMCNYYNSLGIMMNVCIDGNGYISPNYLYMNASELVGSSMSAYAIYDKNLDDSAIMYLFTISKKQDTYRDEVYKQHLSDTIKNSSNAENIKDVITWIDCDRKQTLNTKENGHEQQC